MRLGEEKSGKSLIGKGEEAQTRLPLMRVAAWERYGWMRHGFSTRRGGVSEVYGEGSLNLGWTKEDESAKVSENRRRFLEAVACGGGAMVGVRQIHSAVVRVVEEGDGPTATADGRPVLEGDGLMTDVPGRMLAVGVADCVPVVVADVRLRAVAAFHAGWRGTAARIVEHGVMAMRQRYGSRGEDLVAAVGPSIGPCCYAVGSEVRETFAGAFAYGNELLSWVGPETRLNLWEANRRQLLDAGLGTERIEVMRECSSCARVDGARRYFSHRAESGVTGRMMGMIGVVAD